MTSTIWVDKFILYYIDSNPLTFASGTFQDEFTNIHPKTFYVTNKLKLLEILAREKEHLNGTFKIESL